MLQFNSICFNKLEGMPSSEAKAFHLLVPHSYEMTKSTAVDPLDSFHLLMQWQVFYYPVLRMHWFTSERCWVLFLAWKGKLGVCVASKLYVLLGVRSAFNAPNFLWSSLFDANSIWNHFACSISVTKLTFACLNWYSQTFQSASSLGYAHCHLGHILLYAVCKQVWIEFLATKSTRFRKFYGYISHQKPPWRV